MFAQREKSASPVLWIGVLFVYLVATRWPLAPTYLYYFDSANFAFALERFNPALHQPQPPGYPLFVALTKTIHLLVARPEAVFLIAGLLAAAGAALLAWILGREMFGRAAGVLAAVLLASDPVFWFGGITNQVRMFLALGALSVALLGWRALTRPDRPVWLYAAFAALGVAGGFRPALPAQLLPLLLWVWWRTGARWRRLGLALAALAAAAIPWAAWTVVASGGPEPFLRSLREYSDTQFQGSSALFGAAVPYAWRMFLAALVWNGLGTLAWIWALPLARRAPDPSARAGRMAFLALALVPPFLFSAFVHIGDPDHALASISILSLIGGAVLARWTARFGDRALGAAAAIVIVTHTAVFLWPPSRLARAASYRAVVAVDRMTTAAMSSIQAARGGGPLTIVHYGSLVASRQVAYYFPDDYVIVLPPAAGDRPQVYFRRLPVDAPPGVAPVAVPATARLVCLLPWNATGAEAPGWRKQGAVYVRDGGPGDEIRIGPHILILRKL